MSYTTFDEYLSSPQVKQLIQSKYDACHGKCEYTLATTGPKRTTKKRKSTVRTCGNDVSLERLLETGNVWYQPTVKFKWGEFPTINDLLVLCDACDSKTRQCHVIIDNCRCTNQLTIVEMFRMSTTGDYNNMCLRCYERHARDLATQKTVTVVQQNNIDINSKSIKRNIPPQPDNNYFPMQNTLIPMQSTLIPLSTSSINISSTSSTLSTTSTNGSAPAQIKYVHPAIDVLTCSIGYTGDYLDYQSYLKSKEWSQLRDFVLYKRANGICEEMLPDDGSRCIRSAQHAHHIDYFPFIEHRGYCDTPKNLVALCNHCHEVRHTCVNCKKVSSIRNKHIKLKIHLCDECRKVMQA